MNSKKLVLSLIVTGAMLVSSEAVLADDASGVKVTGFLTTIFTKGVNSQDATYDNGVATNELELDSRDNHLGVQFSNKINPKMNVTAQIIGRGGETNGYNIEADWEYVDYQALDHLRFRIGRYKIPQFITSDYRDVGYAYPWVRPPQDVYSTNPLISLNGVDALFKMGSGPTKMFFDLYYGDGTHDTFVPATTFDAINGTTQDGDTDPNTITLPNGAVFTKGQQIKFDTSSTVGFGLKLAAPHFTVRAGYFKTKVSQDDFGMDKVPGAFGGVGFTMDYHNVIAYAEFIRRNTDPLMAGAFPDQDAWYATLGYRMGKLLPAFTVSRVKPGIDPSPLSIEETSEAFDLRYDLAPSADMKLEILNVTPKNGSHGLFDTPVSSGRVYSLAFDVIF